MIDKYKVIVLCGSAKFKEDFLILQKELTLKGNIVLLPLFFDQETSITEDKLFMLKDIHLKKISIADEIFIINKNGYIGTSTKLEIEYANSIGIKINYLEPIKKE